MLAKLNMHNLCLCLSRRQVLLAHLDFARYSSDILDNALSVQGVILGSLKILCT